MSEKKSKVGENPRVNLSLKTHINLTHHKLSHRHRTFSHAIEDLLEQYPTQERLKEIEEIIENLKIHRRKYEDGRREMAAILDYMKQNSIMCIPEDVFDVLTPDTRHLIQTMGIDLTLKTEDLHSTIIPSDNEEDNE